MRGLVIIIFYFKQIDIDQQELFKFLYEIKAVLIDIEVLRNNFIFIKNLTLTNELKIIPLHLTFGVFDERINLTKFTTNLVFIIVFFSSFSRY